MAFLRACLVAAAVADRRNVYDPEHRVIDLRTGPRFISRMPDPVDCMRWRAFMTEDAGGVGLSRRQNPDGGGWSDTVTYEGNIK